MRDRDVVAFQIRSERPWPSSPDLAVAAAWPVVAAVELEPVHRARRQAVLVPGAVPALQELRRRLLTRCAWCGGRSRTGDLVNTSHQWDGPRGRWWRGDPGLFYGDCSSMAGAHTECLYVEPGELSHGDYGACAECGRFRAWQNTTERLLPPRTSRVLLASLPMGSRIPADLRPELERLCLSRASRVEPVNEPAMVQT